MVKWCKVCGRIIDLYNENICNSCRTTIKEEIKIKGEELGDCDLQE